MVVLVVPLTILVISPAVLVVSPATIAGSCGNCHNVGRVGVRRRKGFGDRGRLTFRPYESPKIIEGYARLGAAPGGRSVLAIESMKSKTI